MKSKIACGVVSKLKQEYEEKMKHHGFYNAMGSAKILKHGHKEDNQGNMNSM